jgi:hypothetical protein
MVKGLFSKKEDQGAELLRDKTEGEKASDVDLAKLIGPTPKLFNIDGLTEQLEVKESEPLIARVDEFNIDSKLLKDMLTLEEGGTTENPTLKE